MYTEHNYARVTVSLEFLTTGTRLNRSFDIVRHVVEDNLRPLPRNRELFPWEMQEAIQLRKKREDLVNYISRSISMALISELESLDTEYGYDKK